MTGIVAAKTALRQQMFAVRAAMTADARSSAATALAGHAARVLALSPRPDVSGFCAVQGEIDPSALIEALQDAGALLALPRVAGKHLTFHRWQPGQALVPGRYGIPEPLPDAPQVHPHIMLVPLVGFDRAGNRLGYGGGFFDRVLADHRPDVTIGVAYAAQEAPAIPVEAHDQPLDFILTERGLIDCRAPTRD